LPVSKARLDVTTLPSPGSKPIQVPSCAPPAPAEFLHSVTRSRSFDFELAYRGSCPHRGMTKARPLSAKGSKPPLRSVLRLSRPLDGLLRALAPWVYSAPQPRPGFIPFRGFSLDTAVLRYRSRFPHAVSHLLARHPKVTATIRGLDSEAFFRAEKRSRSTWFYPGRRPLPSSGSSSFRCTARALGDGYPSSTAHELRRFALSKPKSELC